MWLTICLNLWLQWWSFPAGQSTMLQSYFWIYCVHYHCLFATHQLKNGGMDQPKMLLVNTISEWLNKRKNFVSPYNSFIMPAKFYNWIMLWTLLIFTTDLHTTNNKKVMYNVWHEIFKYDLLKSLSNLFNLLFNKNTVQNKFKKKTCPIVIERNLR